MTVLIVSAVILAVIIGFIVFIRHEPVPLLKAAKRHRTQEALALIKQGADVNVKNGAGETPLYWAAYAGDLEVVRALIERGADPNAELLTVRRTALMDAAYKGHADTVRALLGAGADANTKDWNGNTALMMAALSGCKAAVDDLLRAGADPNVANKDRKTALMEAIMGNRPDAARALVKGGADVNVKDPHGNDALRLCLTFKEYALAQDLLAELIRKGSDIDRKDQDGITLLSFAVSTAIRETAKGSHPLLNIVRTLVKAGADVSTALGIAQMHKAENRRADPMGLFDRHLAELTEILTNK